MSLSCVALRACVCLCLAIASTHLLVAAAAAAAAVAAVTKTTSVARSTGTAGRSSPLLPPSSLQQTLALCLTQTCFLPSLQLAVSRFTEDLAGLHLATQSPLHHLIREERRAATPTGEGSRHAACCVAAGQETGTGGSSSTERGSGASGIETQGEARDRNHGANRKDTQGASSDSRRAIIVCDKTLGGSRFVVVFLPEPVCPSVVHRKEDRETSDLDCPSRAALLSVPWTLHWLHP